MTKPRRATPDLIPLVYQQLRALARRKLTEMPGEISLEATALVHEAYLRLARNPDIDWKDDSHLLAASAQAIRWILVDRARRRFASRHGRGRKPLPLEAAEKQLGVEADEELLALDAALQRLARHDRRKYETVALRYFAGLSVEETARALGVSPATVKREWNYARAWLLVELGKKG